MSNSSKRILSVTIKRMLDDSPDTSYLGEYSSRSTSEFSIDRRHDYDCVENNPQVKQKLERIADYIHSNIPVCEHDYFYSDCSDCTQQKAYNNALEQVQELTECSGCARYDRNTFKYFNPGSSIEAYNHNSEWLAKIPESDRKQHWYNTMREYVLQDYQRMESLNNQNWHYMGIEAIAEVQLGSDLIQTIRSGGLWGIESDSDRGYIREIEQEQLSELRTQLSSIGFSKRQIATAFKNVETKESR